MRSPCTCAALDHAEDQPVRRLEQLRQFDAQPGEIVDVEKAAVVDLLGRDAPDTRPGRPALRADGAAGESSPARRDRPANAPHRGLDAPLPSPDRRPPRPVAASVRRPRSCAALGGSRRSACEVAGELRQRRAAVPQDVGIRQRRDRKAVLVIPGAETALAGIEAQRDLAVFRAPRRTGRRAPAAAPGPSDRRGSASQLMSKYAA